MISDTAYSTAKCQLQRLDDRTSDLNLDRENVRELAIVPARPQVKSGRYIDELRSNAELGSNTPHASLEYGSHTKLFFHLTKVDASSLESERRRSGSNAYGAKLTQVVQYFFSNSVAEVFVFRFGTAPARVST